MVDPDLQFDLQHAADLGCRSSHPAALEQEFSGVQHDVVVKLFAHSICCIQHSLCIRAGFTGTGSGQYLPAQTHGIGSGIEYVNRQVKAFRGSTR
ncbi:hypothetical protein SDC9_103002 [bioreactor metagenome]|uniref:Uncharacterized protein n=1 Tax=bioreactor metagenome TaxID=1076179 RepID=A0A645ASW0_9ZZZZ